MRKTHHPWIARTGGMAIVSSLRTLMSTLDVRAMYVQAENDPANPFCQRRGIYIFWHEYISIPFCLRGHCNISMLLSRHRDAEWLAHAANLMGFGTVRGSSNWGSIAALKELIRVSRRQHLAITPDGPRGPRREMAQGPIYLASKLQMPIIPMGFGMDRPIRFGTWDKFALPRPFTRARMIMGEAIHIPKKVTKEDVEFHRLDVQRVLNHLTVAAEKWAESGLLGENEVSFSAMATPLKSQSETSLQTHFWRQSAQRNFKPVIQQDEAAQEEAEPTILRFRSAS
ncbi:lysophospholipid acyltransferase family protein [Bremerella sp. T1]|uniref:lysophospholipid acyltransferase family protein n=1 Tax=Bremerella sp. TYQ1 TaxID=3119568 RepID=UPI001CCAE450|nr:lysophospholipid acyltransferase family protein [Bremerella volcania]UBM37834.1 lysophospholipid acyltransferase family protein [Bremerella volcania]